MSQPLSTHRVGPRPDLTAPAQGSKFGYLPLDDDRVRIDLSSKLVKIRPMDAVRFTFNDVVDQRSFRVTATGDLPNTLAIAYSDDFEGRVNREVVQTAWGIEVTRISGPYQFAWESANTLLIGPPAGGWPSGKYVRFEFDRSLKDDAGNGLIYDRDQAVIARVSTEVACTILRPTQDQTFVPWSSGDEILGRAENFTILVAGMVVQRGAIEHVRSITVTATSNRGLVVKRQILAGDHERRELRRDKRGGSDWIPDNEFGGTWAIQLTLQSADWRGEGCQIVVEGHHTWQITAEVELATGRVKAANHKVVRFELFQSRVLMILCPQLPKQQRILYHWKYGEAKLRRAVFTRADLGLKQFVIVLDGEFDESMLKWNNSYLGDTEGRGALYWERRWSEEVKRWVTWIYLPGFHIHNQITEVHGLYINRMIHKFEFRIQTVAGYVIRFVFPYYVDTLPLDLVNVESVEIDLLTGGRRRSYGRGFISADGVGVSGGGGGSQMNISGDNGAAMTAGSSVTTIWDEYIRETEVEASSVEVNFEQTFEGEIDIDMAELFPEYIDPMPGVPAHILPGAFWDDESALIANEGDSNKVEIQVEHHEMDGLDVLIGTATEVVGTLYHEYSGGEYVNSVVRSDTGETWILRGGEFSRLKDGVRVRSGGTVDAGSHLVVDTLELEPVVKPARRKS